MMPLNIIEFNTNFLETNIVNILILISLIIYAGQGFFRDTIDQRRIQILDNLNQLDINKAKAKKRFISAKKQFKQIDLVMSNLQEQSINQNLFLLKSVYDNQVNQTNTLFDKLLANIQRDSNEKFKSLQKYVLLFAIAKVLKKLILLKTDEQQDILENIIATL